MSITLMIKRIFPLLLVCTLFAFVQGNCGADGVDLGGEATYDSANSNDEDDNSDSNTDSADSTDCTDTGEAMTTGDISVTVSGTPCNAPSPSSSTEGTLILGCDTPSDRDASAADVDYVTVSCGTGAGATEEIYYCTEGIVYNDNGGDGIAITASITVTCTIDGDGEATLSEEELVIS
ncbi:MAG: hypothetical protein HQM16_17850 [Deltaproteobacteria bacterium]|nr:hypothetical protein [Deltaproteobacteria bacterium]